MTDNNIKKHIIKFFFGRYIILPIRDILRGKGFWDKEKGVEPSLIADKSKYISKALWKKSKKFKLNCAIYNEYIKRKQKNKNI